MTSETEIVQTINNQNSNKAHGHDMISIRILKLCAEAVCRPLNTGKFPSEWEKGNIVPIHKKMASKMLNITLTYMR